MCSLLQWTNMECSEDSVTPQHLEVTSNQESKIQNLRVLLASISEFQKKNFLLAQQFILYNVRYIYINTLIIYLYI